MKTEKEKKRGLIERVISAFLRHARKNQTGSRSSSTLRTNFSVAMWSIACVFGYFLLVFIYIYLNGIATSGNAALFFVLVGALIAALIGAFYSSQLARILSYMTPSGRRQKFMDNQKRANKKDMRR